MFTPPPIAAAVALLSIPSLVGEVPAQAPCPPTCIPAPAGLIGWWDGNDVEPGPVASDIVGGNDGLFLGTAGTAPGRVGDAFAFDGAGLVDVGNPAALDPGGDTALTVDLWTFLTSAAQQNFANFIDKRDKIVALGGAQWAMQLQLGGLKPEFGVVTETGSAFAETTVDLTVGAWHHLAGTYDGTAVRLYVDGLLAASAPLSGPIRSFPNASLPTVPRISIGAFNEVSPSGTRVPRAHLTGLVDEVEILDRALTAAEILALFDAGSLGKCKDIDSDGDGLLDSTEASLAAGSGCPCLANPDSDGDSVPDGVEVVALGTNPCVADTDDDGVPDGVDPLPTIPGVTSGFLESELRSMSQSILGLELALLDAKNDNAKAGLRNAMSNKVNAAANAVAAGDSAEALEQLGSLLAKLDGEPAPEDWMIDSTEKAEISAALALWIDLISLL